MLSKKKKIVILCSMIALLILTGVLNVILNNQALGKDNSSLTSGEVTYGNFFLSSRAERKSMHQETMEVLDSIIANAASNKEAADQALEKKNAIADMLIKEQALETLVKALGYEDCIVTVSTNNINCLLKTKALDSTKVTQILNTLSTETGCEAIRIKITPIQ